MYLQWLYSVRDVKFLGHFWGDLWKKLMFLRVGITSLPQVDGCLENLFQRFICGYKTKWGNFAIMESGFLYLQWSCFCDYSFTFFKMFCITNTINFVLQFISHLVNQLARHQFLKIACQLEKKNMLGAYSLLKVIESELQAYLSATKGRVVLTSSFNICFAIMELYRSL